MSETRTVQGERTNEIVTMHDYGFTDAKGRAVGARVKTYDVAYVEAPADAGCVYIGKQPGLYFGLATQGLRGGKDFGPGSYGHYDTAAERDAAAARYLKGHRARNQAAQAVAR